MCSCKHDRVHAARFTQVIAHSRSFFGLGAMADNRTVVAQVCLSHRVVGCNLNDHGIFCCLLYTFPVYLKSFDFHYLFQILCPQVMQIATVAVHHNPVLVSLKKWVVLMGGAINRSLISTHFSISAYTSLPFRLISAYA